MNNLKVFLLIAALVAVVNGQDSGERAVYGLYKLPLSECDQSSNTTWETTCDRAIDGIRSYSESSMKCFAHLGAEKGWWSAKTHSPARIRQVHLYNRRACCQDRLTDFTISVDGNACAKYKSETVFIEKSFDCAATGQEVLVLSKKPYLTLAEVEVFGEYVDDTNYDIKLFSCNQSSTRAQNTRCEKAYDGSVGKNSHANCSHLDSDKGWWSAKFKNRAHVKRVKIFNRPDCCRNRLNDFDISVDGVRCHRHKSNDTFIVKTFACDAVGEEIKITSRIPYLTLCEVKVYGKNIDGGNYKLRLISCKQKSVFDVGRCERAIYNDSRGESGVSNLCAVIGNEKGWWQATTLEPAHIKKLLIQNRMDCCRERLNDFEISVDGLQCLRHKSNVTFLKKTFKCDAIGKLIKITCYKIHLTLCGVTAFGEHFTKDAYSKTYLPVDASCRSTETGRSNEFARQVVAGSNKDCRLQCTLDNKCKYYKFQNATCTVSKQADDMQFRKTENANDLCNEACSGTRHFCIFQQRIDNSVRFNRTWTEYGNGFGNSKNYWTGLKWLHAVTSMSKNATFRAELTFLDGKKQVSENSGFLVEGANTNYRMSYKSYSSETPMSSYDSMDVSNGKMFSTTDRDNDEACFSCSNYYHGGAGWWFSKCTRANPNGIMPSNSTKLTSDEAMHWVTDYKRAPLKSVRLLVTKPE